MEPGSHFVKDGFFLGIIPSGCGTAVPGSINLYVGSNSWVVYGPR